MYILVKGDAELQLHVHVHFTSRALCSNSVWGKFAKERVWGCGDMPPFHENL